MKTVVQHLQGFMGQEGELEDEDLAGLSRNHLLPLYTAEEHSNANNPVDQFYTVLLLCLPIYQLFIIYL